MRRRFFCCFFQDVVESLVKPEIQKKIRKKKILEIEKLNLKFTVKKKNEHWNNAMYLLQKF